MSSGFADVDASADPGLLVGYLEWVAEIMAAQKAHLIDPLALQPGDRTLDIGCGAGHDLVALTAAGTMPVGIDPSAHMVGASRRRCAETGAAVGLALASGELLPFPDMRFDAARIETRPAARRRPSRHSR